MVTGEARREIAGAQHGSRRRRLHRQAVHPRRAGLEARAGTCRRCAERPRPAAAAQADVTGMPRNWPATAGPGRTRIALGIEAVEQLALARPRDREAGQLDVAVAADRARARWRSPPPPPASRRAGRRAARRRAPRTRRSGDARGGAPRCGRTDRAACRAAPCRAPAASAPATSRGRSARFSAPLAPSPFGFTQRRRRHVELERRRRPRTARRARVWNSPSV